MNLTGPFSKMPERGERYNEGPKETCPNSLRVTIDESLSWALGKEE